MARDEYVLRDRDAREIRRLGNQHQVWKEQTDTVVRRAGFRDGNRLLDLGSGPGFATFELADLAGPAGSVLALDTSERFIEHIRTEAARRGMSHVRAEVGDVRDYPFEEASLDGAFCRWVLMFLADARRAVDNVARALRPGGVLAVMEYFQFRSIALWPESESFKRLYEAVHRLIGGFGGDADLGSRMPGILSGAGFEIVDLIPFWRVGRPGSPLWSWLEEVNENHANLVSEDLLDEPDLRAYYEDWRARSRDPAAFVSAPPLLATIARKL